MITNTQQQISLLKEERDTLSKELGALVASGKIDVGSDAWYQYTNQIAEFDNAIMDANISMSELEDTMKNITFSNLQIAMDALIGIQDTVQGLMDLRQAQGKDASESDYRDLISSSVKQIENLEIQNAELRKQQIGLDVLSEKYIELQNQIDSNNQSILSAKTSQEGWNDSVTDLKIDALTKQNEEYKDQISLMDAIENLEKAKQRRALVYHEGTGFQYEADQEAIKTAQNALDDLLFDQQIRDLEKSKITDNLYDDFGNELKPIFDTLSGLDFASYHDTIANGVEDSSLLAATLKNLDNVKLLKSANAKQLSVTIESGAIALSGVNNPNALAEAIAKELPNAMLQEIYAR